MVFVITQVLIQLIGKYMVVPAEVLSVEAEKLSDRYQFLLAVRNTAVADLDMVSHYQDYAEVVPEVLAGMAVTLQWISLQEAAVPVTYQVIHSVHRPGP